MRMIHLLFVVALVAMSSGLTAGLLRQLAGFFVFENDRVEFHSKSDVINFVQECHIDGLSDESIARLFPISRTQLLIEGEWGMKVKKKINYGEYQTPDKLVREILSGLDQKLEIRDLSKRVPGDLIEPESRSDKKNNRRGLYIELT